MKVEYVNQYISTKKIFQKYNIPLLCSALLEHLFGYGRIVLRTKRRVP